MSGQAERPEEEDVEEAPEAQQDEVVEGKVVDDDNPESEVDVAEPASEVEQLQSRVDENWDKYLRTAAELENVRKRAARDVENAHKFALERFSTDLLDVRDSLEMALTAGEEVSADTLREGTEATCKLLTTVMQRFGVKELDPQGEPFDPACHEAMTMQPSADAEPGSVLTVIQKGYALNGRLLRPARVVVAAEPPENGD